MKQRRDSNTATQRQRFLRPLRFESLAERLPFDAGPTIGSALSLGVASIAGVTKTDNISPDTDVDMFQIQVTAGQTVDFDVDTAANGPGGLGSFLRLFNSSGTELAFNNDGTAPGETFLGYDAYLRYTFTTAGNYYVSVSNNSNTLFNPITGTGTSAGGANTTGSYSLTATALPIDTDDTIPEATNFSTIGSTPDIATKDIDVDIDVDLYSFTATAGQSIDFDIDTTLNGPGGLGSYLRIFDSNGNQIAANNDGVGVDENVIGYDSFIRFTFTTAGTYYVGVSNSTNTAYNINTGLNDTSGGANAIGSYKLYVQTTPTNPNDTDDEIGEAFGMGAVTTAGASRMTTITPAVDVDMYRFTVTAGQIVDFDIDTTQNGSGGLGSFIRLFNASGTELAFNNDAAAPGETIGFDSYLRYTFATAGTYYLGVSNSNNTLYNATTGTGDVANNLNAVGQYTLTIQGIAIDTDDQISEATPLGAINATPKVINKDIDIDIDVDMYQFTASAGQVVDFDIDTTSNGAPGLDSFIRVFDSNGNELAWNNNGIAPGENVAVFDGYVRYTFASAGSYYVGVSAATNPLYNATTGFNDTSGSSNSTGSYTLTINTAPAVPIDGDDAISEAIDLGAIGTTPKVSPANSAITPDVDVDMYRFTATAGQSIDFDIDTALNGTGGLGSYIRLFNSSGVQLAANNDGTAPGENTLGFDAYLRYTFATAGTYYLGVSNNTNSAYNALTGDGDVSGGANSTGAYTLTVTGLPDDTDDTFAEAPNLGSITSTPIVRSNQSIDPDIDVDLIRFTVTNGDSVDFDIDTALNGVGGLGSYLRLFNASGTELASNDDGAAPGESTVGFDSYLRYAFSTGGTYYLGVSNNTNRNYNTTTGGNDTAGGQNSIGAYTLTITLVTTSPTDTNDQISEAIVLGTPNSTPIVNSLSIAPDTDVNMYQVTVTANQTVEFDIDTPLNGPGGLGSYLRLFDSTGTQLAFNNDAAAPGEGAVGYDAYLQYTFVTPGNYYIGVSNANNFAYSPTTGTGDVSGGANATGNYQLIVSSPTAGTPALSLSATLTTISEPNTTSTFTVTRSNASIASALVVSLSSSDTSEATVPTTVTIPANQLSATFTVTAVDDLIVDGTQNVTITATATGLTTATQVIQVADNDVASTLSLSTVASFISESGGSTTGTITRSAANISSALVVSLSSSDTTEATVPNTVTIPANQTSVSFTINAVDDAIIDGTQSVTISASASGFSNATTVLQVTDNDGSILSLTTSVSTISETNGSTTGTVTRTSGNITQPLVVTLSSSDTTEATVPATVTIPANQTSATFTISAVDDAIVDGTQSVTIFASASGFTGANVGLQVTDNDVASTLALSLATSTISELNGTTTGTVTRSAGNISQPLVVNLSSSDTSEATVPVTVTIPANQVSVTFTVTGVDDLIVDGTQSVTLSATATGFSSANVGLQVTDNDSAQTLSLSASSTSISEFNGTSTGTVSRNTANISSPLVVTLTSSDTTEATVPATVTIPANQVSVTFTITAVDDSIVDGSRPVTITATASGLTTATLSMQVNDNDSLWQNPVDPLDVNNDGKISAFDVIPVINFLNQFGAQPVPSTGSPPPYLDVNSDNQITAFDAIPIINYLNENPVPPLTAPESVTLETVSALRSSETPAEQSSMGPVVNPQTYATDLYFAELAAQRERDLRSTQQQQQE
ncbi:beta strand repeat-containing protein [Anatilimnocola floriformis]|uniref:beta strand repeat-containing protein n=1 Tax=Anatilimnocola floriformis TaxID=2948575 RepID=UPI0020C31D0F|nr:DVUA0089 family protein [Anatilimnocola floriformis]